MCLRRTTLAWLLYLAYWQSGGKITTFIANFQYIQFTYFVKFTVISPL